MSTIVDISVQRDNVLLYVTVQEDTLVDMVSELNDQVGLVHQLPFVSDKEGFASVLEKVGYFLNFIFSHLNKINCFLYISNGTKYIKNDVSN